MKMLLDDTQNIHFIKVGDFILPQPERATEGSSGYDLRSREALVIGPGEWKLVRTGWRISMPRGIEAQVRSRSGLALKNGISVLNSPGTIDSDYDKEICVILINNSTVPFGIDFGDRIAQLVFAPVILLGDVPLLTRDGGFGSTGT